MCGVCTYIFLFFIQLLFDYMHFINRFESVLVFELFLLACMRARLNVRFVCMSSALFFIYTSLSWSHFFFFYHFSSLCEMLCTLYNLRSLFFAVSLHLFYIKTFKMCHKFMASMSWQTIGVMQIFSEYWCGNGDSITVAQRENNVYMDRSRREKKTYSIIHSDAEEECRVAKHAFENNLVVFKWLCM